MRASFDIQTNQIPSLVTWFNLYVGFSTLNNRIDRVERKLANGMLSDTLLCRYQFHQTYRNVLNRKRLGLLPDIHDFAVANTLSFVASVEAAHGAMSDAQRDRLRTRIIDGLSPDRDIRQLQHELRAFVHYSRAGYKVDWIDNDADRYDFLVYGPKGSFELECKTFAENIGNPISTDVSIYWFDHVQNVLDRVEFPNSGTFEIQVTTNERISQSVLVSTVRDFVKCTPARKQYEGATVQFQPRPDFDRLLGRNQREALLTEFADWQSKHNRHCMVAANKKSVLFFSLHGNRAPRPYNAICNSLKHAAKQFSATRPAVIWGHFLGLSEEDMRNLLERNQHTRTALDVFGSYLFKAESRNHVCRLRLSADGDLLQGSNRKMVRGGGPAYDLNSAVSRFDNNLTDID
ncbi:MAG TPA: hypothetical protein VIJ52_00575 [Pseudolabrys sp.]